MDSSSVDRTPMTSEQCREFKDKKSHYLKRRDDPKRGNRKHRKGDNFRQKFEDGMDRIDWSKK